MSVAEGYVDRVDTAAVAGVLHLDKLIRAVLPSFHVSIKYGMLMYSTEGDWRTWVCAIGTSARLIQLRFLYGVLLDDPKHVLRKGSSVLMTWDFDFDETIDAKSVEAYVKEAVAKKAEYVANSAEIQAAAKRVKPTRAGSKGPSTRQ